MDIEQVLLGVAIGVLAVSLLGLGYTIGQNNERIDVKRYGCEAYLKAQGEGK